MLRRYGGEGIYVVETLDGVADDTADADGVAVLSFAQAQVVAREMHVGRIRAAKGLPAKNAGPYTVRDCIDDYLHFLETERKSGKDARWRASALILPELGKIACADLTPMILRRWLHATASKPARVRTRKGQKQQYREADQRDQEQQRRRRATANRVLTILKAALNRAWRDGKIDNDGAWRRVIPFEEADAARVRHLTANECQRFSMPRRANSAI